MGEYYLGGMPLDYAARTSKNPEYFKKEVLSKTNATEAISIFDQQRHINKNSRDIDDYEELLSFKEINKGDNLYKDAVEPWVDNEYDFSRNTVMKDIVASQDGIKYGKAGDSNETSALEFAKSYIKLGDTDRSFFGFGKTDGKLGVNENSRYFDGESFSAPDPIIGSTSMFPVSGFDHKKGVKASMNIFDVTGDKGKPDGKIDEKEIAATMILADTNKDGTVSKEESLKLNESIDKEMSANGNVNKFQTKLKSTIEKLDSAPPPKAEEQPKQEKEGIFSKAVNWVKSLF